MANYNNMSAPETNHSLYRSQRESIKDSSWLKNTFMLGGNDDDEYNKWLKYNRYFSTADIKASDTHIANSIAINPHYQFTRYADIRRVGVLRARDKVNERGLTSRETGVPGYHVSTMPTQTGLGFGTYYSRAIDDNQQRVFIRFGEPQYMSMLVWAVKSFDLHKAILYKRGHISKMLLSVVGKLATIFGMVAAPGLFAGKYILDFIINPKRFMSVRDNMYTYWTIVDTILNKLYVKRTGLSGMNSARTTGLNTEINKPMSVSKTAIEGMNALVPNIVDDVTGRISVWGIALSGQAAYNRMLFDKVHEIKDYGITEDPSNYRIPNEGDLHTTKLTNSMGDPKLFVRGFLRFAQGTIAGGGEYRKGNGDYINDLDWIRKVDNFLNRVRGVAKGTVSSVEEVQLDEAEELLYKPTTNEYSSDISNQPLIMDMGETAISKSDEYVQRMNVKNKERTYNRYRDYLSSMLANGAAFLVLNVEPTGSVGESFSNTSKTNPIETVFNGLSSKMRALTDGTAGLLSLPGLGDVGGFIIEAAMTVADKASAGFLSAPLGIAYGATISLPKLWDNSTATMPSASYKVKLISPYGNAYSQLFSIYLPLAAILAGALPRSVGQDSFTSPFMLQLFDRGRVNIPMGMVESVNILRGSANLSFTRSGHPTAIDVDLSITDLNQVMAVDIDGHGMATRLFHQFTPEKADNSFETYLDTVAGMDVYSMFYDGPNLRLKLMERYLNVRSAFTDPAGLAAMTVGNVPILSNLGRGIMSVFNTGDIQRQVTEVR